MKKSKNIIEIRLFIFRLVIILQKVYKGFLKNSKTIKKFD